MTTDYRGKRIVIYARVSTKRQAQNDLSVPDQIALGERWIAESNAIRVKTFVDAGASATNDGRTEFQAMMALAMSPDAAPDARVDVILVHSLSRLFRNALHFMQYKAQLQRHKVRIISITQTFGDDPASELAIGMLALNGYRSPFPRWYPRTCSMRPVRSWPRATPGWVRRPSRRQPTC